MTPEQELKLKTLELAVKLTEPSQLNCEDSADDVIRAAIAFEQYINGTYQLPKRQELSTKNE